LIGFLAPENAVGYFAVLEDFYATFGGDFDGADLFGRDFGGSDDGEIGGGVK